MARHKDYAWNLPEGELNPEGGRTHSWESVHAALLMDLRDELKRLNELLYCNQFVGIPRTLNVIAKNTRKRRSKNVKAATRRT